MALPLSPGLASSAAKGTMMWVTAAVMPMATLAATRTGNEGASPAVASASDTPAKSLTINRRRSPISPKGTSRRIPAAYPSCVATATVPLVPGDTPNVRVISSNSD